MRRAVVLIVIAVAALLFSAWLFSPMITSGYGGLSTEINNVELGSEWAAGAEEIIAITPTVATVTPSTAFGLGMTGLKMELGQPQYAGDDITYTNTIVERTESGEWRRDWEVRIAYFDLGFTIVTNGGGLATIPNVHFWIEIQQNIYDVFTAADDVRAYILEVVTKQTVEVSDPAGVKVTPSAGGYSFDMDTISSEQIPDWIAEGGYQGALSDLKHIRFKVTVEAMAPTQILTMRYENGATWRCQIRSLVFGFWEVLSPYDEWTFDFLGIFSWLLDLLGPLFMIFGLALGVVATVAILYFIPDKRFAAIILAVIWAFIILGFGFLELLI